MDISVNMQVRVQLLRGGSFVSYHAVTKPQLLLINYCLFAFSLQILPLVMPTKLIMEMSVSNYEWHEFFPNGNDLDFLFYA